MSESRFCLAPDINGVCSVGKLFVCVNMQRWEESFVHKVGSFHIVLTCVYKHGIHTFLIWQDNAIFVFVSDWIDIFICAFPSLCNNANRHNSLRAPLHWTSDNALDTTPSTRTFLQLGLSRLEKELTIGFLILGCFCERIGAYYLNSRWQPVQEL